MVGGGRYRVRGYRENQWVRDNGVIGSVEARVPVVRNASRADVVELTSFVDAGTAWNTKLATPDPRTLYSIGLGVCWAMPLNQATKHWHTSISHQGAEPTSAGRQVYESRVD
jgi:hemolysin activation/secretion protein